MNMWVMFSIIELKVGLIWNSKIQGMDHEAAKTEVAIFLPQVFSPSPLSIPWHSTKISKGSDSREGLC